MNSLILSTATRLLMPLILALSVFVFLRGHNEPGGGFIGGLLAATAFALLEKAEGLEAARRALRCAAAVASPRSGSAARWSPGSGAGSPTGTSSRAVWPFLTVDADGHKHGLPVGSILLFDLGVYLVVLGTVCAILFALEEVVAGRGGQGGLMEILLGAPHRRAGRRRRLPDDERQDRCPTSSA